MKIIQITILSLVLLANNASGQSYSQSFMSKLDGKRYSTRLTDKNYSKNTNPNIYIDKNGKLVRSEKSVSYEEAVNVAISKAKSMLGARYGKSWVMKEFGVKSNYFDKTHIQYYYAKFRPIDRFGSDEGELQIVVTLDGLLIPLEVNEL